MTLLKYENIDWFGETKKYKETLGGQRNFRNKMIAKMTIFKSTNIMIVLGETKRWKVTLGGKRIVRNNVMTKIFIRKYEKMDCFGGT